MASTVVEIKAPDGLTMTLELYAFGSDTLANSGGADTLTQKTNNKGTYSATVTEALRGWYDLRAKDAGGTTIVSGYIHLDDTTATFRPREDPPDDSVIAHRGTAQAAGSNTITLQSGASTTDDLYNDMAVIIAAGTGVGQSNRITDYVGSTLVATCQDNWITQPDSTSEYQVLGRVK